MNRSSLIAVLLTAGIFLTTMRTGAQVVEMRIDSLTLEGAVKLAPEHHPSLRAASANLRSAAAGLTQARSAYFPSLTASATAQHTDGAFVFNPDFPPRNQTYNNYTAGIQASQTLVDFGRLFGRVSANSRFVDAAESDYDAARATVIMNVELAFFGFVQAKQIVAVTEEAVARAADHLREAKAFYSVGKRAQFDVTRTEVDLANANVSAIRARNQLRLAKLSLDNAMGIHASSTYAVADLFEVVPVVMTLDSAKSLASATRPELISAQARVEANRSLAAAAWDQHLPTVSAFGAWNWSNFDFPLFSRWNAGLTLTLPIFQGFGIQAQVDQARAAADAAQANLEVLRDAIMLDVEQNFLSLKEAGERITATSKLVEQAAQSLNLAERQYAAGVGSAIEITDAQLTLSNARITRIQALYDYNSSLARLKRAIGETKR